MSRLQAVYEAIDANLGEADALLRAKLRGLVYGYDRHWMGHEWQLVGKEQPFLLPVVNPSSNRLSRTFQHAGRTDGEICRPSEPGRLYGLEQKTTSDDIEAADATYWKRLPFDGQVSGYALARWQMGMKLSGTLYDVVRKPSISPKKLSKADRQRIIVSGVYFGVKVPEDIRQALAGEMDRENEFLYEARLRADCRDRAERYFQRRVVPRLDAEILEHAHELWETADEIRRARAENRHYRNSNACLNYGRPCQYLGICSGHDTPESDNWQRVSQVHKELDDALEGDGRDVLTHSRLSTFRLCRRKHFYRYELGIEKQDQEEADSLKFGRIWHEVQSVWWSFFSRKEHDDGDDDATSRGERAAAPASEAD